MLKKVIASSALTNRQVEFAECGLACLSIVFDYYGLNISLRELRDKYTASTQGMRPYDVRVIAEASGLTSSVYKINVEDLKDISGSLIVLLNNKHFVVLTEISADSYEFYDPISGYIKYDKEHLAEIFSGMAIVLKPKNKQRVQKSELKNKERNKNRLKLSDIYKDKKNIAWTLAKIFLWSIFAQSIVVLFPLFTRYLIDDVIPSKDVNLLYLAAGAFLFAAFFGHVISFTRSITVLKIGQLFSQKAIHEVFQHLLFLPVRFFENRHVGDISSRMNSMGRMQQTIITDVPGIAINIIMVVFTFTMMFYLQWFLALTSLFFVVMQLYYSNSLNHKRNLLEAEKVKSAAEVTTCTMDIIQSSRMIKLFGIENRLDVRWQNNQNNMYKDSYNASHQGIVQTFFESIIASFHLVIITTLGIFFILSAEANMTIGTLFAMLAYQRSLSASTRTSIRQLNSLNRLNVHLDRLSDIVLEPTDNIVQPLSGADDNIEKINVEFSHVSFHYDNVKTKLIKDLSFSFAHGETIAIIGASGTGKTTLIKLLLGLYKNYTGEILINGMDLKQESRHILRASSGVVMQNDQLLRGTVAENISLFDKNILMEKVEAAARHACIAEDILEKPLQYDTQVGGLSSAFSSGQMQRILIARAIYDQPKLLIMDEGTANLDEINEIKIGNSLNTLDCLKIYITHRPALVERANRVFVMSVDGLAPVSRDEALSLMGHETTTVDV